LKGNVSTLQMYSSTFTQILL